jgi:hypothetical protein
MLTPGVLPIFQPGCYATPRLEPVRFSVGSDVKNDQTKDLQNPRYDQAPAVLSCKSYIHRKQALRSDTGMTLVVIFVLVCFSYDSYVYFPRKMSTLNEFSKEVVALIQLIPLAVAATFHGQSLQFADWSRSFGGGSIGTFPLSPGSPGTRLSALSALSHLPHVSWPRSPWPGPGFYSGAFHAFGGATASFTLGP